MVPICVIYSPDSPVGAVSVAERSRHEARSPERHRRRFQFDPFVPGLEGMPKPDTRSEDFTGRSAGWTWRWALAPREASGGQSELINLTIYSTPIGNWIEGTQPAFRLFPAEATQTGLPIVPRGPVRTKGARKGRRPGTEVQWEIEETTEATELLIFIAPSSDLERIRYQGPDGRSAFRQAAGYGLIKQPLAEGDNEIEVRRRDGSRVVFRARVNRPGHGEDAAGQEKKILDAAEKAVREYMDFRAAHPKETHVPAYHGIITLGELKKELADAEHVGSTLQHGTTTLIQGESGTGKELVARLIYTKWVEVLDKVSFEEITSKDVPYVVALSPTLVGDKNIQLSRLFGCRPGFTNVGDSGAPGYFLQASGYKWVTSTDGKKTRVELKKVKKEEGVLFLDEVGDLYLGTQAFLLRTMQNGIVEPLGWEPVPASPKVLMATNKNASNPRVLRPDLKKRIDYFLSLPPLRQRVPVIPHLVYFFTEQRLEKGKEYLNQRQEAFDRKAEFYKRRKREYDEEENLTTSSRLPRMTDSRQFRERAEFLEEYNRFREKQRQFSAFMEHFLKSRPATLEWNSEALAALASYSWPGNLREVAKVVGQVLFSWERKSPGAPISLDELPGYIRRNYEGLKEAVSQEHQEVIEAIGNLAKELLTEAWKDLPEELLKQDGEGIPAESRKEITARWANIIDLKLAAFKDWLKQHRQFEVPPESKPDCMSYLSGWHDALLKAREPEMPEAKRVREARARAKWILVRVKGGLKGVPMSSAVEKRLTGTWAKDHHAVLSRFFGITMRALNQ